MLKGEGAPFSPFDERNSSASRSDVSAGRETLDYLKIEHCDKTQEARDDGTPTEIDREEGDHVSWDVEIANRKKESC